MANVKFNRGTVAGLANLGSNPFDQVTLVRDTATAGSTDYNSIYLGTALVGTSMLGLMKPQKMQTPTYDYSETPTNISWAPATIGTATGNIASGVITTDVVNNEPIVTVRTLVDYATAIASGYAASASDSEILTAKAVTALVSSVADNTYYTAGGWGYNSTDWKTWTAIDSGTNGTHNFSFTLPVESDNIILRGTGQEQDYSNELLPTSKAVTTFVENYFAGLAGGMRYMGSISGAILTPPQGQSYKAGDVFIASGSFTIPAGTTHTTPLSVEAGDMVVINTGNGVTSLTADNSDVFERNLDGAITGTLTSGQMVRATASNAIESIDTAWDQVAQNSSRKDQLDVTRVTNGTAAASATQITIDDIYHAKYVQTSTTVASGFKSVMVDGAHSADTTDHSGYVAPALATNVKIDPATGEIQLTYQPTGAQQSSTINVAESITNINGILEWHEL